MYYSTYKSPIGLYTMAAEDNHLLGLWKVGQKYYDKAIPNEIADDNTLPVFIQTTHWLDEYFKGNKPEISQLPIDLRGTDFRLKIWEILSEIPYGETIAYGEIAKILAQRQDRTSMSAQAVGGAVGHNPLSIIIPCHRVVGTNGSLTGYAGGLSTKIKLLKHEGVNLTTLFVPKKHAFYDEYKKMQLL